MDEAEMRRRFERARVAHLASATSDAHPHVVPCVFALAGSTAYTPVDHKPKRSRDLKRIRNIRANPHVALLTGAYDDEWRDLWWVRLDGVARVVDSGPEFESAIALLADKYPQYHAHPIAGPVIAVEARRFSGWEIA
jgi:PPOX class probable F420-dependent enzyme